MQLPKETNPNPLADIAQQVPDVPVKIPVRTDPSSSGVLTLTARRMETAQIIAGPKMKLSTADRFVRLVVSAQTTKETTLDLTKVTLSRGNETFELARDVQRVGQGSPLAPTIGPGISQDLVLYFEAPPSALVPGLNLVVPVEDFTATLPLL